MLITLGCVFAIVAINERHVSTLAYPSPLGSDTWRSRSAWSRVLRNSEGLRCVVCLCVFFVCDGAHWGLLLVFLDVRMIAHGSVGRSDSSLRTSLLDVVVVASRKRNVFYRLVV